MKRFAIFTAVAALSLAPIVVGIPVHAASTCDIGFTGPDSQNMCTSTTTYVCTVTNTNEVVITNETDQEVASGDVVGAGNTTGGETTSGTVSNDSGTTFTVVITNPNFDEEEEGVCTAAVVVPATEPPAAPTPTPTASPAPMPAPQPAVLPATSGTEGVWVLGASLVSLAIAGGASIARRFARSL